MQNLEFGILELSRRRFERFMDTNIDTSVIGLVEQTFYRGDFQLDVPGIVMTKSMANGNIHNSGRIVGS